ncbi:MAG: hypothetical protein LBH11_06570 [Propionibacteriaceae bacterium]|jgi:DNA-directed RNA polymerase specialized sigma24 family protein|nr:hypothetical protein [Propionibacteriaceae bacterium]
MQLTYLIDKAGESGSVAALPLVDPNPDIVVARLRSGDDTAALELVARAQAGDRAAGELVLAALGPRLAWQCRRDPFHTLADYQAAAWERIMRHPIARRRNSVLINIALDALKILSRERAATLREIPVAEVPEPRHSNRVGQDELPFAGQIIDLAARRRLVPAASIPVLRSVYTKGLSSVAAAKLHGMTPEMVRYRCSAAIKVLRKHREELLQDAA